MSETVFKTGKLTPIKCKDFEKEMERIMEEKGVSYEIHFHDTLEEAFKNAMYSEYYIFKGKIYKIDYEEHDVHDVFHASQNKDGTIDFKVVYHNGWYGIDEAIEEAVRRMEGGGKTKGE